MDQDAFVGRFAERTIPRDGDFLSRGELSALTPAELTRRIAKLAPMIAGHAAEAERLRHPVDEVWSALRASGFFYQFVPKKFGGMATDFDSYIDAVLPIAEACASTGWVAAFCAGHNFFVAQYPEETQEELFGGAFPYVIAPSLSTPPGRAVRVEGGVRVTGTWKWATGIMHADWVNAVAVLADGDGPPQMRMVLFPAAAAEVIDTWQADGMAGTGSNDVHVDDLFVPDSKILSDMGVMAGRGFSARTYPEPVWRTPMIVFATMIAAVPVLGAAKRAWSEFANRLASHVQKGGDVKQAEKPAAQLRLARADLMIRTAELLMREAGRRAVALGTIEEPEHTPERIAVRAQLVHAVSLCRTAALHLAEGAGSGVHMLDQPFQRALRDIGLMSSHVGLDVDIAYEQHGRALVGLPPNSMLA
jgi:3-hydroxy-9,10-secoandrosta-1,3,5(10)-triene-9,17-dione monooxygenase